MRIPELHVTNSKQHCPARDRFTYSGATISFTCMHFLNRYVHVFMHSFPACPPTLLESHQLARNGTASVSNEGIAPFCSVQDCSCKTEAT